MANDTKIRVNYFVMGMLAQGGEVRVDESKIIFSPTSALDKAMGATEVEIPLQKIREIEHRGDVYRTFNVKTEDKIHKFEGAQAKKLADILEIVLQQKGLTPKVQVEMTEGTSRPAPPPQVAAVGCGQCRKPLMPEYAFCPYCGAKARTTCASCRHVIESDWKMCAFCGLKL